MATARIRLMDRLSHAEWRIARRIEGVLEPAGLTLDQWRVLSFLSDGVGHPMTEIAGHAMVPPPTLTKLVDKLADANLVYRRIDDRDRRRVLVLLSERGQKLHRKLDLAVGREERSITDQLGPTDTEKFVVLLDLLLDRLR